MTGAHIVTVFAWEGLDSRGRPTVACSMKLADGTCVATAVPAGASRGRHEAVELRDGDERYGGFGVRRAVAAVKDVTAPAVLGFDVRDQRGLDSLVRELDGTPRLQRLGANAVLAVSITAALAAAANDGVPLFRRLLESDEVRLPLPMVNILSGGAHAGGLLDIQDVLAVPVGAESFAEAIEWAARVRSSALQIAETRGLGGTELVADEGGLAFAFRSNSDAIKLVATAIEHSGLEPMEDVAMAVDVAATSLSSMKATPSGASNGSCRPRTSRR